MKVLFLTCPTGLISWWGAAGLTLAHWVYSDHPELVVDKGGELQYDRVEVSRVGGQVLPPAWIPVVLLKLNQKLCEDTECYEKRQTPYSVEMLGGSSRFSLVRKRKLPLYIYLQNVPTAALLPL